MLIENPEEKATKVVIKGTVFSRQEKAPFTPSGKSVYGAFELTEDESEIKCHQCGEWRHRISGPHVRSHRLSAREYRLKHGLRLQCALQSPVLIRAKVKLRKPWLDREIQKKRTTSPEFRLLANQARRSSLSDLRERDGQLHRKCSGEFANLKMNCRAQLTMRLTNMASRLGHTPTTKEMAAGDKHGRISRGTIMWAFSMTPRETLRAIGLTPNERGGAGQRIAAPIELRVLQLRAKGLSYAEIAHQVGISDQSVRNIELRGVIN